MDPITARDTSQTVAHMFNLMDAWRHVPNYRLEGRLAPFFELFLLDVLGECLPGVEFHPVVIPEFPLRKGTLDGEEAHAKPNESYNVDYVAFSMDRRTAILVELKTDMSSVDDPQKRYLRKARKVGLGEFVGGAIEICGSDSTKVRSKYVHLIDLLAQLELVTILERESLYQMTFPKPRSGWTEAFRGVKPAVDGKLQQTRVIYIQPRKPNGKSSNSKSGQGFEYIDFKEVADTVEQRGDLGCRFANYLRKWTEDPGRRYPRTVAYRS